MSGEVLVLNSDYEPLNVCNLRRAIARRYLPFAVVLSLGPDEQRALAPVVPWLSAMTPVSGAVAAYVCANFTCRRPATSVEELERELTDA